MNRADREISQMGTKQGLRFRVLDEDAMTAAIASGPDTLNYFDLRQKLPKRIPRILWAIDLIEKNRRLPTAVNVQRAAGFNVREAEAQMAAMTWLGLSLPYVETIGPHESGWGIGEERTVLVRSYDFRRPLNTHHLSDEGRVVLYVHNAMAEEQATAAVIS